jgi:hypothetical protein
MQNSARKCASVHLVGVPVVVLAMLANDSLAQSPPGREVHPLVLADPVNPASPPRLYDVVLSKDQYGFPDEYELDFQTSVCTDGQCRLVELTMVWRATAGYERLHCPPGKPLTKKEHVPFTEDDYVQLDRILKDSQSLLGDWRPDDPAASQQAGEPAEGSEPTSDAGQVDAVTMPTPIEARTSVVKDAAYTTWTLWQWANGPIVPKLRAITQRHCSVDYVNHLLVSSDLRDIQFALDHVRKHRRGDPPFVEGLYRVLEHGEQDQISEALELLSAAVTERESLHAHLVEACLRMRPHDCPIVLQRLAAEPVLSATTLEQLTANLDQLPYYPIHLILKMLEAREVASDATLRDVAALLDCEDFFIARRAYEHLCKHDLDAEMQSRVAAFGQRHRDRL